MLFCQFAQILPGFVLFYRVLTRGWLKLNVKILKVKTDHMTPLGYIKDFLSKQVGCYLEKKVPPQQYYFLNQNI